MGDTSAFEILYTNYSNILYGYLKIRMTDDNDIRDIMQEVFLCVWRQCSGFNRQSKLSTWIIGIARNKLYDVYRYKQKAIDTLSIDEAANTEGLRINIEGRMDIEAVLSSLPACDRELLHMIFNIDLTYKEIASVLNVPEGTVKSRMHKIRSILRNALENGGDKGE